MRDIIIRQAEREKDGCEDKNSSQIKEIKKRTPNVRSDIIRLGWQRERVWERWREGARKKEWDAREHNMNNAMHPLHALKVFQYSTFSGRVILPKCTVRLNGIVSRSCLLLLGWECFDFNVIHCCIISIGYSMFLLIQLRVQYVLCEYFRNADR